MSYFENVSKWDNFRDFTGSDKKFYRAIQQNKEVKSEWELFILNVDGRYSLIGSVDLGDFSPTCYNIYRKFERQYLKKVSK